MKILFDHPSPFLLAHGGFQIQIEQTKKALEQIGVAVEWLRWWDAEQKGDLIHYFGVPHPAYISRAHSKRLRVVTTNPFSETCNRSDFVLLLQSLVVKTISCIPLLRKALGRQAWQSYAACDMNIVGLKAERELLLRIYGTSPRRATCVPLGLETAYIDAGSPSGRDGDYLIATGTITAVKGSVELARLARKANVPILFVGKPYAVSDPVWQEFNALIDNKIVRHQTHVDSPVELVALLQSARGFVAYSRYENWCLSAHEAAACGLPLLLPDKKWSRERFGTEAHYFTGNLKRDAGVLQDFFERCPNLNAPKICLYQWTEVAEKLRVVYEEVLSTSW